MLRLHRLAGLVRVFGLVLPPAVAAATLDRPETGVPQVSAAEDAATLLWQRGYLLHLLGNFEAAVEYFRRSIAVHPRAIEAAKRSFERALDHDPNYAPAREGLRVIEEVLGRPL